MNVVEENGMKLSSICVLNTNYHFFLNLDSASKVYNVCRQYRLSARGQGCQRGLHRRRSILFR